MTTTTSTTTSTTTITAARPAVDAAPWLDRSLFPFTSRFFEHADASLHYVDEWTGRGADAPTVLFLHGSPMWSFMFRHSIAALRQRARCVALDLPGLGLSRAELVRGHAFERNAQLMRQFVERRDLNNLVIVAHATAGPSALDLASREVGRVRALVLSNSFAWPLDDDPRLRRIVRVVSSRPFGWLTVALNLLPRLTARLARRTGRFTRAERDAILGPYRQRSARRHLANLLYGVRVERDFFADVEQRARRTLRHVPTLLLYGRHDNGYRAGFVERWRQLLPRHQVHVLDRAGHFPCEDEPQAFSAALQDFVGSVR